MSCENLTEGSSALGFWDCGLVLYWHATQNRADCLWRWRNLHRGVTILPNETEILRHLWESCFRIFNMCTLLQSPTQKSTWYLIKFVLTGSIFFLLYYLNKTYLFNGTANITLTINQFKNKNEVTDVYTSKQRLGYKTYGCQCFICDYQ